MHLEKSIQYNLFNLINSSPFILAFTIDLKCTVIAKILLMDLKFNERNLHYFELGIQTVN